MVDSKIKEFFRESEDFIENLVKLLSKHQIETELDFDNMVVSVGKLKFNFDGKTVLKLSPKEQK